MKTKNDYIEVIDFDPKENKEKKIKLLKDSVIYYTDSQNKNYTIRYDFYKTFKTIENYFLKGYESLGLNEFNKKELKTDNYEGLFINKVVTEKNILNHYYTFIGFENKEYLMVIPVKMNVKNKFTVDPTEIKSSNWYYRPSNISKNEYIDILDILEGKIKETDKKETDKKETDKKETDKKETDKKETDKKETKKKKTTKKTTKKNKK